MAGRLKSEGSRSAATGCEEKKVSEDLWKTEQMPQEGQVETNESRENGQDGEETEQDKVQEKISDIERKTAISKGLGKALFICFAFMVVIAIAVSLLLFLRNML